MTGIDHEMTAKVDEAAVWLAVNWWKAERPLVPGLRKRFGITAIEAIEAMREAARVRGVDNGRS